MKNRSQDYYRHHRNRVINRKKKIIKLANNYWHTEYDGILSKGKIHCSCWMCSNKSKVRGLKISDLRKEAKIEDQLKELEVYKIQ